MITTYLILDEKRILFPSLSEKEMFVAWSILTAPEVIKENYPEDFEKMKLQYPMPEFIDGKLRLVKLMAVQEDLEIPA